METEAEPLFSPPFAPMVKGILLALAVAWLAVANPNATVNSSANSNPATITSAHGSITSVPTTPVPEPSTLISLVFGVGLLGGVLLRLRSSR